MAQQQLNRLPQFAQCLELPSLPLHLQLYLRPLVNRLKALLTARRLLGLRFWTLTDRSKSTYLVLPVELAA